MHTFVCSLVSCRVRPCTQACALVCIRTNIHACVHIRIFMQADTCGSKLLPLMLIKVEASHRLWPVPARLRYAFLASTRIVRNRKALKLRLSNGFLGEVCRCCCATWMRWHLHVCIQNTEAETHVGEQWCAGPQDGGSCEMGFFLSVSLHPRARLPVFLCMLRSFFLQDWACLMRMRVRVYA